MLDRFLIIPQVLNIPGFEIFQGYTSFFKKMLLDRIPNILHATALNMPRLQKVLNKILHYRYLTGF